METCDACGPAVKALCGFSKGESQLFYCGHHTDKFFNKLTENNWIIIDAPAISVV